MFISGNLVTNFAASGALKLDLALGGDMKVTPKLTGDIYSTVLLESHASQVSSLLGKLTFPSMYIGELGIESFTPVYQSESFTNIYTIEDFYE